MKDNYLYHWTKKEGFDHIKKYGINGIDGWFHTLLNDPFGGLYEYISGRLNEGDDVYCVRILLDHVINNDSNECYMDHNLRIGDPNYTQMKLISSYCGMGENGIKICDSKCDPNEPFGKFESYWEYVGDFFSKCDDNSNITNERRKYLNEEFINAFNDTICHIPIDDIEFIKVEDALNKLKNDSVYKEKIKWTPEQKLITGIEKIYAWIDEQLTRS